MRVAAALALTIVTVAATAACGGVDGSRGGLGDERAQGAVHAVIDGDTIDVDINGRTERVRLIGVDTPETRKPDAPIECYGPEATAYTGQLLPVGTTVRLVRDVVPRDDYGRLLAYVYRQRDGLFVNDALLRNGYARPLTIAPNDTYRNALAVAGGAARSSGAGLWSHCDPEP